jgi:hypothetical protein
MAAVQHAVLYYENGKGSISRIKPRHPTVNGQRVKDEKALFSTETMLELATRRGLLDVWKPVCMLQFKSNHSMTFKGSKAKQKWKQYNQHIYGK